MTGGYIRTTTETKDSKRMEQIVCWLRGC